jgi:DNA helicase-2/ATP-dependent DNA helicase PcrA
MPNITADQIYALLSPHSLTDEQRKVIEGAPTDAPALVIAGAGSGKTELMTLRVLYLVANGLAVPGEILGLTFTRKAASELSGRVSQALYKLRETQFWPQGLDLDFTPANITTYNSFGNDIFRRLSLSVGYESDANLITEAAAIQLADELVKNLTPNASIELEQWERTKGYLIELILELASELTDNLATAEQMKSYLEGFVSVITQLPKDDKGSMEQFQYVKDLISAANQNQMLADLAQSYIELKAKRHLVDFSDQVALALRAIDHDVANPYRFVLLDEYQDTSSIQTQLLSKLFRGMPVLAVGDPNQAIYGWRGASSNNLSNFHTDFASPEPKTFTLSRSWRSGPAVVAAANQLTQERKANEPALAPVNLLPGNAGLKDSVLAEIFQDELAEARGVAQWFADQVNADVSAALLLRTKSSMQLFADAIASKGLAVEVTGLSGLLQLPEVVDLIAALKVVQRPESGAELMRLLAGPKWRLGAKDIAGLSDLARKLSRIRPEVTSNKPITLVEALDELNRDSTWDLTSFSAEGSRRLKAAAGLFRNLRKSTSMGLSQFAWAIARELELDIELFAHSPSPNPLANLESFIARIADYEQSALRPSLSGLLNWFDHASQSENFELPKTSAKKGVVQIMSVHAAKGLEWDVVAVGQLNKGGFPIEGRGAKGWLGSAKLPYALRGDCNVLPVFQFQGLSTQKDLKLAFDQFQAENRQKQLLEERRLAYVAVTRARKQLLLTASHYKSGVKKPREISIFLQELLDTKLVTLASPVPEAEESNPLAQLTDVRTWPFDPLGRGRQVVESAADAVRNTKPIAVESSTELTLLLEERERGSWLLAPRLPMRVSASRLISLISDPASFAASIARPLPQLFDQNAQRGTNFHLKLEELFRNGQELELAEWEAEEVKLGVTFLNSRFSKLTPAFVEQVIQFQLAGFIVVCKIDAIFETPEGYEIVDWKSGSAPTDLKELERRSMQLSIYRIAFSKWRNVPLERIQASFFFAGDGQEVSPESLATEAQIVELVEAAKKARRD